LKMDRIAIKALGLTVRILGVLLKFKTTRCWA
jgi:hypothetical protein